MKRWYRQTLARRILITAMLAFVLCFAVITAFNFYQAFWNHDSSVEAGRKAFVESLSQSLSQFKTDDQVRAAAEGVQRMIEAQTAQAKRPDAPHILVWTHNGHRVYASIGLPTQRPPGLASAAASFDWGGQRYTVTSVTSPRYTVDVIDSTPISSSYRLIIQDLLSDLLVKMLIAFPLVLLPIWFAVHTGLRPLGALSDGLHSRSVNDLTPFASNMRYEELQPMMRAINELMERLQSKIRQEHSFVHDAAHELQTPLAVIANQTHVLAAATTIEERAEAHRSAEHAVERAGHVVRQMLILSRLDSDLSDVNKTFDAAANVRELLAPLVPEALVKSIELTLESPDQVLLHGDPSELHSIIGNLVDNALRYIGEGSQIQVEIESGISVVTLRVLDDGSGIRAEDQERVFDRYYRVAGTGVSGSGLGLAIVKQAVARMRGTISLGNGLNGRGCAFVVELPAVSPQHRPSNS